MRVIETVAELQAQSAAWRAEGESVGFVPTMGALHMGHLSLVEAARRDNSRTIVSVFVNPTQFDNKADLATYPRDFEGDLRMLGRAGVDVVFNPTVEEMYPSGLVSTFVSAPGPSRHLEGSQRPGHFDGVLTVVARLFNAALADRAYLGQKDAQQLLVIRAMVRDLGFPIELVACPTVREPDGLAMSSRNARLLPAERERARVLSRALGMTQTRFAGGERDVAALESGMRRMLEVEPGVSVDYATIVDADTFAEVAVPASATNLVLIAARVGAVRLIDNAALGGQEMVQYAEIRRVITADVPNSQGALA